MTRLDYALSDALALTLICAAFLFVSLVALAHTYFKDLKNKSR